MTRRARLTILESGASATAWASCRALGADDWIVVAQLADEAGAAFTDRVNRRVQRLLREGAEIDSVDVYAGPEKAGIDADARRAAIRDLTEKIAEGGSFTLWSSAAGTDSDPELAATLALMAPILAKRQVAVNHQAWEAEERSGVRHAVPERRRTGEDDDFDFSLG